MASMHSSRAGSAILDGCRALWRRAGARAILVLGLSLAILAACGPVIIGLGLSGGGGGGGGGAKTLVWGQGKFGTDRWGP